MPDLPLEPHTLARLDARLRSLARALVGDAAAADDLTQDAWVAALERPAGGVREPAKWLRGVLRHRARGRRRAEEVRRDHELATARPAWHASDAELIERLSTAELLVRTVDALEEPYGRVLRLRFLEERSLADTARALDAPPGTVKTWTRRGLERLREELDRTSRGDRAAWAAAMLRFVAPREEAAAAGAAAGRSGAWIAAAALFVVGGTVALLAALGERRAPTRVASEAAEGSRAPVAADASAEVARAPLADGVFPADAPVADAPPAARVELETRVVDAAGWPLAGATVRALDRGEDVVASATTDAEGRARLALPEDALFGHPAFAEAGPLVGVEAVAPGLARSACHFVALPRADEAPLELRLGGPGWSLRGRVVDADGAPVHGARLVGEVEVASSRRIADGVLAQHRTPVASTDASGGYALEHLALTTRSFQVGRDGFLTSVVAIERQAQETDVERELVLDRGRTLVGTLQLPDGSPAAGAIVHVPTRYDPLRRHAEAVADERGRYVLGGTPRYAAWAFASAAGDAELGARVALGPSAGGEERWDARLEPVTPLVVSVLDADGAPEPMRVLTLSLPGGKPTWERIEFTREDGRTVLRELPAGPLRVALWSREYSADRCFERVLEEVRPSGEELVLRAAPRDSAQHAALRARLVGSSGAQLLAWSPERREERAAAASVGGAVELRGLEPGPYALSASFQGAGLLPLGEVELAAGETLDLFELEPPPLVPVRLAPLDAASLAASSMRLSAVHPPGEVEREQTVGELDPTRPKTMRLLPGDYRLELIGARRARRADFSVWPDEPLELDLAALFEEDDAR